MTKSAFRPWPTAYSDRVYAGVLGKIIGVYLGRPFEGWTHDRIVERFGEITYYVNDQLGVPLVVADDDISGTFTFLRALADNDCDPDLTPAQIGETWLNYLVENRNVLWWGGMGTSTEHTAYLRLRAGIPAPRSGSIDLNGRTVAEQIGAQIFIDGWGLICPGEPDRAADFARRAASVSHDGEAIYAAQVVAALVALAFDDFSINRMLDGAVTQIPPDCLIARLIADVREWHAAGLDWRAGFRRIEERYGYDKYGGGCHVVPNHALVIHALVHGRRDFSRSLMIINTCGWDTDCNSGNVGCILGVRNGVAGMSKGHDWRGPVADRIYLPTADGGRCITDAATEAFEVVRIASALRGIEPQDPKAQGHFHFYAPGSVQGFRAEGGEISNYVTADKRQVLALWPEEDKSCRAVTPTFLPPDMRAAGGYSMTASPRLYPGQRVLAQVWASESNGSASRCRLTLSRYNDADGLTPENDEWTSVAPGERQLLHWLVPDRGGYPIAEVGMETHGPIRLHYLVWAGEPDTVFRRPPKGTAWRDAWVNALDHFESGGEAFRLIQDRGTGMLIQGCRDWRDYDVSASLNVHLVERAGIAAHVQGLRRWVALLLCRDGYVRLVKCRHGERVLAETKFPWEFGESHEFGLRVESRRYIASMDRREVFDVTDSDHPLKEGAIAFVVTEGRIGAQSIRVTP